MKQTRRVNGAPLGKYASLMLRERANDVCAVHTTQLEVGCRPWCSRVCLWISYTKHILRDLIMELDIDIGLRRHLSSRRVFT